MLILFIFLEIIKTKFKRCVVNKVSTQIFYSDDN